MSNPGRSVRGVSWREGAVGDSETSVRRLGRRLASTPMARDQGGNPEYTQRLVDLQTVWWKRILPVQAPYRWNLKRLHLGVTIDLGCGIGRNLLSLGEGSVGIDHDSLSVEYARSRGLTAYTPTEFAGSPDDRPGRFDSLLLSHVAEHMTADELVDFVSPYLGDVKTGGKVVLICPQERGFRSDATHAEFVDFDAMRRFATTTGLEPQRLYSFPFPRRAGTVFVYNEFVMVARIPVASAG